MSPAGRPTVLAVVAAKDEADRIADTVRALGEIAAVDRVVVVDDGSTDATVAVARGSGATVLVAPRDLGKGGAIEGALRRLPEADVVLLADGDLGASAAALERILAPVLSGQADLAVAVLPRPPSGGFGLVKRAAGLAIRRVSGFTPFEPLSGQRAMTRQVLEACRPLAAGFGLETALTADAARLGFRIVEVPAPIEHRFTGKDVAGFLHRGRQGWDILRAVLPRLAGLR
jgi:glycosyltransferase involved in cell wall biosynthesis